MLAHLLLTKPDVHSSHFGREHAEPFDQCQGFRRIDVPAVEIPPPNLLIW